MTALSSQLNDLGGAIYRGRNPTPEAPRPQQGLQPTGQRDRPPGRLIAFPYVDLIQAMLEREQVTAARRLIEFALNEGSTSPALEKWLQVLAPPRLLGSKRGPSGPDRSQEVRWLAEYAQAYRGQWVAIEGDRLLAASENLKDLKSRLAKIDPPARPLLHWVEQ